MTNIVKLNYTADEIDERLSKVSNVVLCTEQNLTEKQKAQVRENIGVSDVDYFITKQNINLFDKTQPRESNLLMGNGNVITNTEAEHIAIAVDIGKTYTFPINYDWFGYSGAYYVACYDVDKNYLGSLLGTPNTNNTILTVTITDNFTTPISFVKVNVAIAVSSSAKEMMHVNAFMFVEGETYPSKYVNFGYSTYIDDNIKIGIKSLDSIIADETSPESINLFNINDSDIVTDYYINPNNGSLNAAAWVNTSGYIPIANGKTYTFPISSSIYGWSTTGRIALYNIEKSYIGYASGTINGELLTVSINNTNAAYFRTSLNVAKSAGGYKFATMMVIESRTYPDEFIQYKEDATTPVLGINLATDFVQNQLNPLYKKRIIWNGDSICAGKAFGDEEDAWAGRIANRNNMTYKNYAIGGGTITENVTVNETATHSISGTVDTMYAENPHADYIIFEGGTNDADILGSHLNNETPEKFGAFTKSDFSGNYDKETFCGALESIFYRATNYWKGKKIGFIVAHKMGVSNTGYDSESFNRRNYFETAIQICKKWGIPVLNLWDDCYLNPSLPHLYSNNATWQENQDAGSFYADGQHLLSSGYDYESDIVNNWLKTL